MIKKSFIKKTIGLLLCIALVMTLMPASAVQAAGSDFIISGGVRDTDYTYDLSQSTGDVTITMTPVTGLTGDAKAYIGSRPVYSITMRCIKDKQVMNITRLGRGSFILSIPYALEASENAGCLFGVSVEKGGLTARISPSAYDINRDSIILTGNRFSIYGVGYAAPSSDFSDTSGHWAKESIDYVSALGLLAPSSDTAFSPDKAITRGELAQALGMLADIDVRDYITSSFTDVDEASPALPYIEWVHKGGILNGFKDGSFSPEGSITREQMAITMKNFFRVIGYTLPVTREAYDFTDDSSIGFFSREAVTAMQQAGIMSSKVNGCFDPKELITRAEAAAILHGLIKLMIDPSTAQGWSVNDSGQSMYYSEGKALTGWQRIDEKMYYFDSCGCAYAGGWMQDDKGDWYYFYEDGSLAVSTTVDGHEVDEKGLRITG